MDWFILKEVQETHEILEEILKVLKEIRDELS